MTGSAELRTDLAEDRTLLANERTFAGWLRTGMAAVGVGLAFHVLFGELNPPWLPRAIATLFLGAALLIIWLAERRACAVIRRLKAHRVVAARLVNLRLISAAVSLGTLALAAAIWLVRFP
jgi:putative membrane protein